MAAYNRYRGNGSRAERIEEPHSGGAGQRPSGARSGPAQQHNMPQQRGMQPQRGRQQQNALPLQKLPFLGDLPKKLGELETEDLLLILILYLMYRESGDKELLIIMGAMYLL